VSASPLAIVAAWQDAANARDADRLVALSDPNIEIAGPRGAGRGGHRVLRDWLARAGLRLEPLRAFARGNTVVVEQRAEWRSPETGEATGQQTLATAFTVASDRVARVARHDTLAAALAEAGLAEADQAPPT
jgi:hypothetical protein